VDAERDDQGVLTLRTKNVSALRAGGSRRPTLKVDGQELRVPIDQSLHRVEDRWITQAEYEKLDVSKGLRKRPGLQGPIDDAFLEPFLVVVPAGEAAHPAVGRWVDFEIQHLVNRWRALYRGELPVKADTEVTERDIADHHLVLFGDPAANTLVGKVIDGLPIDWTESKLTANGTAHDASNHVPLMIHPNPLNPERYVVLNSGPTHREAHDRTNSLQNPKLPDWAVVDVSVPPDAEKPGKIVDAGFFDERWRWKEAPE